MELGGNIVLEGFDDIDKANLVVVKKMVGNYGKTISEKKQFKKLILTYKKPKIEAILELEDKQIKESADHENLFFSINQALSNIIKKIK
jgi:ribosome-associated translation inhibitor RaiA